MDRCCRNFEDHDQKSLYCFEKTVDRNRDVTDSTSKSSEEMYTKVEKNSIISDNISHHKEIIG